MIFKKFEPIAKRVQKSVIESVLLAFLLLESNQEKQSDTHVLNAKLPSSTGEPGIAWPSWFSAVAYHSGIAISRPGARWS